MSPVVYWYCGNH